MKKVFLFVSAVFTSLLFVPKRAFAAPPDLPKVWLGGLDLSALPTGIDGLMKARSWEEAATTIVPGVFNMIFFIGILIFVFLIIRAGFMFILAEGNKENLVKARGALVSVVIGFALLLSVFLIFNFLQLVLGVNLTGNKFFGGTYSGGTGQPDWYCSQDPKPSGCD